MDNLNIKIIRLSDNSKFEIGKNHDWVVAEDGLENFGVISNVLEYADAVSSDGGLLASERVTKTDRTITMIYRHQSGMDIARANMLAFFNRKDAYRVVVAYGTKNVFADGKIYKFACDMVHLDKGYLRLTLTFMFANPFWKSVDNFGRNIASVSGKIAFPYLVSMDKGAKGLTGGIFNFAQKVNLYNDGDTETRCNVVIKANGSVVNPRLLINDDYVRVIDEMVYGDEIIMDFAAIPPTVKKNGENYIGHCDRTSAFDRMILERGDNEVAFDADNGTSSMAVTIYYNKQYGAI